MNKDFGERLLKLLIFLLTVSSFLWANEPAQDLATRAQNILFGKETKVQSRHALALIPKRLLTLPQDLYQRAGHKVGLNPLKKLRRKERKDQRVSEILKPFQFKRLPKEENSLAYYNNPTDWDYLAPRDIGYCRGMAHIGMSFNSTGIFQGELNPLDYEKLKFSKEHSYLQKIPSLPKDANDKDANDQELADYLNYYLDIAHDIAKNKIRIIPGFDNLFQFTSDPLMALVMKRLTLDIWSINSIKFDTLGMVYRMHKQSHLKPKKARKFIKRLQQRLDLGLNAKIFFSIDLTNVPKEKQIKLPGIARLISPKHKKYVGPFVIHVVEAYGVEVIDQQRIKIKIWDRNYPARDHDYLEMNLETGETIYPTWLQYEKYDYAKGMISDVGFTVEDEYMMKRIYRSWRKFKKNFPQIFEAISI